MASISDQLQAHLTLQELESRASPSGRIASFLDSALTGYQKGRQRAQEDKKAALDRTIKMLDIQKKQADLEQDAINRRISQNLAKRVGLIDLDPNESDTARSISFESLGGGAPRPKTNTSDGRLSSIYLGDEEYRIQPSFSTSKGLNFDFKAVKEKEEKDPTIRNERIQKTAEDAARREKFNYLTQLYGPEEAQARFANVQPTEDEVEKYLPEVTSFLEGKSEQARALKGKRRHEILLKQVDELFPQIEGLQQKTSGIKGFFGKGQEKEELERFGQFFSSQEFMNLEQDLSKSLLTLKKNPTKNRERIRETAERLVKLRSIRR